MTLFNFKMSFFTKKFFSLLWICIVLQVSAAFEPGCENASTPTNATIEGLTDVVNLTLHDRENLSNYSLSITYKWDVKIPEGSLLDGFVACMTDADEVTIKADRESTQRNSVQHYIYLEDVYGIFGDLDEDSTEENVYSHCESYLGEDFHRHNENGSYLTCPFPCEEHGPGCADAENSVCTMVASEGCVLFPKHLRHHTVPIKFGRKYKFSIYPYVGHVVNSRMKNEVNKVSIFCRHHLIENEGLNKSFVYDFCESEQNISVLSTAAGPPADFKVVSLVPNFLDNTVTIVVQWRAPHDVALGNSVFRYFLKSSDGLIKNSIVMSKPSEEESRNPFYNGTISDIKMGQEIKIEVRANVRRHTHPFCTGRLTCLKIGDNAEKIIDIPSIDACKDNATFCDPLASCNSSNVFAIDTLGMVNCSCPAGYEGDGINEDLVESGTGCKNFNACTSLKTVREACVSIADCEDAEPPSMGVSACICPDGYFGDGMVSGSGCTKTSFVIGLSIGLALMLLLAIGIVYAIWKFKLYKRRVLDRQHSSYVPTASNSYINPLMVTNNKHLVVSGSNLPMEPMFGKRWELDRSNIRKENVIGRGNFGVVNKAILTVDGAEKTVAVKALTGAYTTVNIDDFLAEISLLISLGSHENVLNLVGVCTIPDDSDDSLSPLMVTEYMTYGDLLHFLWDSREASKRAEDPIYDFTEMSLFKIGRQVAHGMHYLSQMRIIHGDVAARNILVGEDLKIKISDFGLANDVYRYGLIKCATERRVPFKWISPERMLGGGTPITWRSDVWSFGILLYEIVTLGATPYAGMEPVSIFQKLQSGYRIPQPSSCSDYL